MEGTNFRREMYIEDAYSEIEEVYNSSVAEKISEEKEQLVLSYICDTISSSDDYDSLMKKAAAKDTYAYMQLTTWFISNAENVKDYCKAFKYAKLALKNGYNEANYILGQLYLYGSGCAQNYHKAKKHLLCFIKNCNPDELLNNSYLEDAYFKLAETEKKLKHFDKAYYYYKELVKVNNDYSMMAEEYKTEIKELQKESYASYIFMAGTFVFVCALVYLFAYWMPKDRKIITNKYVMEPKVIHEEPTPMVPENQVKIKNPVSYAIISKSDFYQLNLSEIRNVKAHTTSEYVSKIGNYYGANNLIDGNLATYWQEGESDAGINQSLSFEFDDEYIISAMMIVNGKHSDINGYQANNRIASVVMFDDEKLSVNLADAFEEQYVIFENPIYANKVNLIIKSVFSGTDFNDTCVSEIKFYE